MKKSSINPSIEFQETTLFHNFSYHLIPLLQLDFLQNFLGSNSNNSSTNFFNFLLKKGFHGIPTICCVTIQNLLRIFRPQKPESRSFHEKPEFRNERNRTCYRFS
ncbi:hypothetical protein L6452_39830 [Arctium lappa]|uniref:Uncharacterized protein n=1 Tax=Arctium lappa TaxID=4217 RepID=A0ACB8XUJ6_ARCLA|nr:hypothetical protein L6452_39830 [Arctium lappa]